MFLLIILPSKTQLATENRLMATARMDVFFRTFVSWFTVGFGDRGWFLSFSGSETIYSCLIWRSSTVIHGDIDLKNRHARENLSQLSTANRFAGARVGHLPSLVVQGMVGSSLICLTTEWRSLVPVRQIQWYIPIFGFNLLRDAITIYSPLSLLILTKTLPIFGGWTRYTAMDLEMVIALCKSLGSYKAPLFQECAMRRHTAWLSCKTIGSHSFFSPHPPFLLIFVARLPTI